MTTLIALEKNKYIGTHVNKYPTLKYKYKYQVLHHWRAHIRVGSSCRGLK